MGMSAISSGLKTRLQTISSLREVYASDEIPSAIHATPCAIILPGDTEYHKTHGGEYDVNFRIIILLSQQDLPSALNRIVDYADLTGNDSVYAAIYGDNTLGGNADGCWVESNSGAGFTSWAGTPYLSTEFIIRVLG